MAPSGSDSLLGQRKRLALRWGGLTLAVVLLSAWLASAATATPVTRTRTPATDAVISVSSTHPCRDLSEGLTSAAVVSQEMAAIVTFTNRSVRSCQMFGYPKISLVTAAGKVLPFKYIHEYNRGYVESGPPKHVLLKPGHRAYDLVARTTCNRRGPLSASTLRVVPPGMSKGTSLPVAADLGAATFNYCPGGPSAHGNTVAISPVVASMAKLSPL